MMKEINDRQLAIICFVTLLGMKLLNLPSLLYGDFSFGGILILIFYLLLDLFIIFLILKIKKINEDLTFFEILNKYFTKVISYFIVGFLIVFCFLKLSYIFFEYHNYLSHSLALELDKFTFIFATFPVINAIVYRGIKAFARTTEFFYVFLLIGLSLLLLLGVFSQEFFTVSPLGNFNEFISSVGKRSMWFGDGIIVLILVENFELKKHTTKKVVLDVLLLAFTTILFYISYYVIYQTTAYMHAYALSDIIQFSTKFGNVGKLDIIAILVAIFMFIFEMSIYSICCEKFVFRFVKNKFLSFALLNVILIILIYAVFQNTTNVINFFTGYACYLSWFVSYILPIILFVLCSFTHKRREYEQGS